MSRSNETGPNHALQRTPGFGVQLPGAALIRPAQSRAVLPAMKPRHRPAPPRRDGLLPFALAALSAMLRR
jgi:hypothetical protein